MSFAGRRIEIRGTVQGVGFRPWVFRLAERAGVAGSVRNGPAGVTIDAFADERVLDDFVARLSEEPPTASSIEALSWSAIEPETTAAFVIAPSERSDGERRPAIPADMASCEACLAEIADPRDRRYRYPFTNCTACGPRYTIALDVPYDRAATSMAAFAMCPACAAEYRDLRDRRFHAEPIACPACGPRLRLVAEGRPDRRDTEALLEAAALLSEGQVVALKGLGGYHLACDATREEVVARLRSRKRRDHKPFAVMARDLAMAEELGLLDPAARELLTSVERPIVLLERGARPLPASVAPDAARIGIMLPYTPLHQLLLDAVEGPLVMTSGNPSGEPIAHREDDARTRLSGIAHVFLGHDRAIAAPIDDSVAAVLGGRPVILRRARGYVPRPIALPNPLPRPLLACGAQLKNAFGIGVGGAIHLGPHVGDLDNVESYDAFVAAVDRLERFLRVRPEVVAHDHHPDYLSTRYAKETDLERVSVQHHHAHVGSVMAEHGLAGPVVGVAYDGGGLGTDGTLWGGEIFIAGYSSFERVATLRPMRLAGGERAIRQVWRLSLAALDDAFDGDPPLSALSLFAALAPRDVEALRRMMRAGLHTPIAHGAGRWFDAFGALALARAEASHEGQIAMAFEAAADPLERGRYRHAIDEGAPVAIIDLRPTLRDAVEDLLRDVSASTVAARFHNTLAEATAERVRATLQRTGDLPVVLAGGCFQNARLVEELDRALERRPLMNQRVPPNDGGIALGQAAIAAALIEKGAAACA